MSTKKKGKGGKKGKKEKKDPNKLNQVDRQFYELTVTDLNTKLARLRSHLLGLDDNNVNLTEKLRELEEDRTDVAAHLERTLADRNDTIQELEERLTEIIKVREHENSQAKDKIKDLEAKYKAMHDQLTSEIKLLNGKLNSLDEFRIQRDLLLAKFDDQEMDLKEKDRTFKEAMYNMEQKAVVEKDALKKEVEQKLLQVSEDFTRSSEIRNAGYTRRLIRENIALQKEIDILVMSQIKMTQQFKEQAERHKEMSEQYSALDQVKKQLIRNSQNKVQIIEKLTSNYEKLKVKYTEILKYRTMYENLVKSDVCEKFSYNEMSKKLRILGQRIETLKNDKARLVSLHEQHEAEIIRLKSIILQIKSTVQIAIEAIEEPFAEHLEEPTDEATAEDAETTLALRKLKRKDLLTELLEIVSSHSDKLPETPSVLSISRSRSSLYKPGKMGFLPRTAASLLDIFKREARKVASAEIISPEFQLKQQDSKIIPKARAVDADSLIDVELGSTLYVSSSHEDLEVVQMEEEPLEGEEGSSSDYQSSVSAQQASGSVSPAHSIKSRTTIAHSAADDDNVSRMPSVTRRPSVASKKSHMSFVLGVSDNDDSSEGD